MRLKRLFVYLAVFGPGLITALIDNDASGITTLSVAGARYGYGLLWTIIPTTIALIVVQDMIARMGIATGKGLADLIRENYGVKTAVFLMLGLFIANLGTTVSNFAGWAASMEIFGIRKLFIVPAGAVVVWLLIKKGSYSFVEKILLFACIIYLGYIVSGIMAKPDWGLVFKESFAPPATLFMDTGYLMLCIAIVGTTITPWMQFYFQSSIIEKGIKKEDGRITRVEVVIGSIATEVISFFIIVTCGTLLFPRNIAINEASEAALALQPFAGRYSTMIFAAGLANASLLGAIIVPLATSYYVCEAMGWEAGVGKPYKEAPQFVWIYSLMIFVSAGLIVLPQAPLITLMVLSSFLNGLLLPFILVYAIKLVNTKNLMGDYVNTRGYNIISWTTVIVLIVLTVFLLASMLK